MPFFMRDGKIMQYKRHLRFLALGLAVVSGSALAADQAAERYARLLADSESIAAHNEFVQRQLASQEGQVEHIEEQLAAIDATAAELGPLLVRMHETLKEFVARDLPFSDPVSDREKRMARLDELMTNESVSLSERYRRLIEAYQVELDYGRTLETYRGKLDDGREADFVRVGRITLLYRTDDGEEVGYWSKFENQWVVDKSYRSAVTEAMRIAKKELAPDLIRVPVPAPQEVRL
ncbi:MAG: DUF3450 domain-containing protein [Porticoccaceae bacterium]